MKQILIILGLFASVTTFAQSPRIKLNQITKDTVKGSVLISSPSDSGMVYSRDFYVAYGLTDTVLILYGDTLAATSGIISSVISDSVTITGNGTSGNELKVDTSLIVTIKALNDSLATISASTTPDGVTITGDGSVGNPLKVDTATVISTIKGLVDTLAARGYLTSNQTITLSGDVTGSGTTAITATVVDDSHNHIISNVDFLQDSLDAKANDSDLANYVTLSGTETITGAKTFTNTFTQSGGDANFDNNTLFVDESANKVGIGTSTPSAKLTVEGKTLIRPESTTTADIEFAVQERTYENGSTIGMIEKTSDNGFTFIVDAEKSSIFLDNDGAKTTISDVGTGSDYINISYWDKNNTGLENDLSFDNFNGDIIFSSISTASKIGIGTKTPAYKLDVVGDINASGEVRNSGVILTSDARYKKDITPLYNANDKLMQFNPVSYYWNDLMLQKMEESKSKTKTSIKYGLVAQEVEAIMPEFVSEGQDGYKAIDYQAIITLLIKSNQEQQAIIETQEQKITDLETIIQSLITRIENLENK